MANTFTDNYNLVKSEVGGDNQSWGSNLHTTLGLIDTGLVKGVEDQIMSGITSTAIDLAASGSNGIISTSSNLKYFQNVQVGDKIRVSGSAVDPGAATNGSAAAPVIHTVIAKTSADSITVQTQLVNDSTSTITVAKVLEPVHINSGPIVCAPLTSLSAATRTAGGVGQAGADTTDALVANGDVNLAANVILGASGSNTIEPKGTIKADLIPETDGTYDLGSSTKQWQDLHIDGTANIDSLVADTADINGGTVDGISSLSVSAATISMSGYTIGSNAKNNRTVSTGDPSGGSDGDIHYKY
jgi:hypothetical protein